MDIRKVHCNFLTHAITIRRNPVGGGWLATLDFKPVQYKGVSSVGDTWESALDSIQGQMIDAIPYNQGLRITFPCYSLNLRRGIVTTKPIVNRSDFSGGEDGANGQPALFIFTTLGCIFFF